VVVLLEGHMFAEASFLLNVCNLISFVFTFSLFLFFLPFFRVQGGAGSELRRAFVRVDVRVWIFGGSGGLKNTRIT